MVRSVTMAGCAWVTAHSETIRQSGPTLDQNPPSAPDVGFEEIEWLLQIDPLPLTYLLLSRLTGYGRLTAFVEVGDGNGGSGFGKHLGGLPGL